MDSMPKVSYKPGDSLMVRIEMPEPGGYAVKLLPHELDGYLPSTDPLAVGRVVPATFVCMHEKRALLTYAFMVGTTERVQLSTLSNEENAFAVWADSHPNSFKLRRAIDIIMPPFGEAPPDTGAGDLEALINSLERHSFSGCVKAISQKNISRSAVLLYRGRAVGCIYGRKPMTDPYPVDAALKMMFFDLMEAETRMQIYELPEALILSMSALFLGCPVARTDDQNSQDYLNELLERFRGDRTTACVTLAKAPLQPRALIFFFAGAYNGSFWVDEQRFESDVEYLGQRLGQQHDERLEASILPPEMTSQMVRFGYDIKSILPQSPRALGFDQRDGRS